MEILEKIEPITESIGNGIDELRELCDSLNGYAATVKNAKNQKFLLDTAKQIRNIIEHIDDCASTVYGIAEDADVENEKLERLADERDSLRAVLRDYVGDSTDWREQNYIKSRYGVDVTAY